MTPRGLPDRPCGSFSFPCHLYVVNHLTFHEINEDISSPKTFLLKNVSSLEPSPLCLYGLSNQEDWVIYQTCMALWFENSQDASVPGI